MQAAGDEAVERVVVAGATQARKASDAGRGQAASRATRCRTPSLRRAWNRACASTAAERTTRPALYGEAQRGHATNKLSRPAGPALATPLQASNPSRTGPVPNGRQVSIAHLQPPVWGSHHRFSVLADLERGDNSSSSGNSNGALNRESTADSGGGAQVGAQQQQRDNAVAETATAIAQAAVVAAPSASAAAMGRTAVPEPTALRGNARGGCGLRARRPGPTSTPGVTPCACQCALYRHLRAEYSRRRTTRRQPQPRGSGSRHLEPMAMRAAHGHRRSGQHVPVIGAHT